MVNVGGRSKGCTTCRRRRVKCDETLPVCRRCDKGGFHCDGPKGTTFIAGTIVKSRRSQPAQERLDARKQDFAVQPIQPSSFIPRQNEREVSICYTRKHLLPNGPIDFALQNLKIADIDLSTIETRRKSSDEPFYLASLSFSMLYFGTQLRQTSIANNGYALYGQALKQLNHTLSDPQSCHRDDVILSVVTLAILECLIPTGRRNYLKHMLGLERLLELRSPQLLVSCSPTSSTLYKGVRHMILFASLRTGRPSILARPEWKAALRSHCSNDELQEQDLYDVLADCTVLLAERDKQLDTWDANAASFNFQQNELECKAMALLADLSKWKARWECDEKHAYREENGVIWHLDQIDVVGKYTPTFPTILRFVSDSSAKLLMLYNTTLIYVVRVLTSTPTEQCKGHLLPPLSFPGEQQPAGLWGCIVDGQFSSAERLAALEIVRCIPDYVSRKRLQSNGQFSSPVVQWAVTTAWAVLGGNESAEGRWMMNLLNGNSDQVIANGVWESSPTAGKMFSTTVDLSKAWSKSSN